MLKKLSLLLKADSANPSNLYKNRDKGEDLTTFGKLLGLGGRPLGLGRRPLGLGGRPVGLGRRRGSFSSSAFGAKSSVKKLSYDYFSDKTVINLSNF